MAPSRRKLVRPKAPKPRKVGQLWLESFVEASEIPDLESFKRTGIYWGEDQMRTGLSGFISDPEDLEIPTCVDTVDEAIDVIRQNLEDWASESV